MGQEKSPRHSGTVIEYEARKRKVGRDRCMSLDALHSAPGHVMDGALVQLANSWARRSPRDRGGHRRHGLIAPAARRVGDRMKAEKRAESTTLFGLCSSQPSATEPPESNITYLTGDIGEAVARRAEPRAARAWRSSARRAAKAGRGAVDEIPGVVLPRDARTESASSPRTPATTSKPVSTTRSGTCHHPPVALASRSRADAGSSDRNPDPKIPAFGVALDEKNRHYPTQGGSQVRNHQVENGVARGSVHYPEAQRPVVLAKAHGVLTVELLGNGGPRVDSPPAMR